MTNADGMPSRREAPTEEDADPLLYCVTVTGAGALDMGRGKAMSIAETNNQRLGRESKIGKLSQANAEKK